MEDFNGCPYSNVVALNDTLTILSGKWKLNIIRALLFRKYRFNELQKKIPHITPRMLSKELKELSQTAATEELETKKKIQSRFPDGWKDMYMQLGEQDKQVFWKSIVKEIKISPDTYVEDIIFF